MRDNKEIRIFVIPNLIDSTDAFGNSIKKKVVGIKLSPLNNEFKKEKPSIIKSFYYAINEVWFVSITSLKYLFGMLSGATDSSQLGGPIKIAQITGQVAEHGIIPFISIMAYISVSLGLINLFPIPMLDGGHLMFYLFEKILGRPLKQKTQEGFFRIGLFLLFSLMFFVTFQDLKGLGLF
jgi:regulator of sigma E protease